MRGLFVSRAPPGSDAAYAYLSGPRCTSSLAVRCRRGYRSARLFVGLANVFATTYPRIHPAPRALAYSSLYAGRPNRAVLAESIGSFFLALCESFSSFLSDDGGSDPSVKAFASASLHFINGFQNPLFTAAWSFTYAVFCSVEEVYGWHSLLWNTDSRPRLRFSLHRK